MIFYVWSKRFNSEIFFEFLDFLLIPKISKFYRDKKIIFL